MKKILFLLLVIATCSVAIELPISMIPEKDVGNDIIDAFVEKAENHVEIIVSSSRMKTTQILLPTSSTISTGFSNMEEI